VTSENSQIQALIQQIDEVLDKTSPRLPWVTSSDAIQQRQVLEQTRSYLRSLQQQAAATKAATANADEFDGELDGIGEESGSRNADELDISSAVAAAAQDTTTEAQAQQVLQAVLQEMNYLRSNLLQPMRSDVEDLRLQRDALAREIQQLEQQRQQYGWSLQNPQHLHEFLQAAMAQMQENLTGQMTQMLATLSSQAPNQPQLEGTSAMLSPVERLEHLQRIQAQSDQLMRRLDTTLRVVFESLQSHLQSYGGSLEEGLTRMHDMGQQGEAVFGAFVTRLAQLLGRETSAFLQAPSSDHGWSGDRPFLANPNNMATPESVPMSGSLSADAQINQLLEGLQALDPSALNRPTSGEPIPFAGELVPDQSFGADLEIEALDRTLSQIDLSAISSVETFEMHENSVLSWEQSVSLPSLDDEVAQGSDRGEEGASATEADQTVDAALDLLNQVSSNLNHSSLAAEESPDDGSEQQNCKQQKIVIPSDADSDVDLFNELEHLPASNSVPDQTNDRLPSPSKSPANLWSIVAVDVSSLDADGPQSNESWLLHSSQSISLEPSATSDQNEDGNDSEDDSEDDGEDPEPEIRIFQDRFDQPCNEQKADEQNSIVSTSVETISSLIDLIPFANRDNRIAIEPGTQQETTPDSSVTAANVLLESTIEDLFAAIDAEPIDQTSEFLDIDYSNAVQDRLLNCSQAYSQFDLFDSSQNKADALDPFINAFTLDGLDSLFEGVPSTNSTEDATGKNERNPLGSTDVETEGTAIDRSRQDNSPYTNQTEPKVGTLADLTRDLLQDPGDGPSAMPPG
jgi:hypothetical protein